MPTKKKKAVKISKRERDAMDQKINEERMRITNDAKALGNQGMQSMNKREYIACMVLNGILSDGEQLPRPFGQIVDDAISITDELLKKLSK